MVQASSPKAKPTGAAPKALDAPYLPALRAWDDVNGFAIAAMRRAYWVAGAFAVLAFIGFFGMVYYANQPKFIPYIVQTNKLDQALAVTRAEQLLNMKDDPAIVRATLVQFVTHLRMVTFDPVFQKQAINTGVTPFEQPNSQAAQTVFTFYQQHDPFARAKTESVEVSVNSPVPMSPTSYEIDWTEQARNQQGGDLGTTMWRGFFTVAMHRSGNEQQILLNPGGIYVTNITWSQLQAPSGGQ